MKVDPSLFTVTVSPVISPRLVVVTVVVPPDIKTGYVVQVTVIVFVPFVTPMLSPVI